MAGKIYQEIIKAKKEGRKLFAVLIDPDKTRIQKLDSIINLAVKHQVDYFFIGGSMILNDMLDNVLSRIKTSCSIPTVLFPGSTYQLSDKADAILFLSLISGRNAELLIGKHVMAAPYLKESTLEVLATGYMLIDGGVSTSVSYISNTLPIPSNKIDIAVSTAMAGEMLGLNLLYMDAGSGAKNVISTPMVRAVSEAIDIPLIIGGGIKDISTLREKLEAGADIVVIGDSIEKDAKRMTEYKAVFDKHNSNIS